ncbi:MAG TPA: polysaccharide deacetylase family protein [Geomonas sp.]|nr:polysaccharide deacetylase family protein [Geomonas sp.]
MKPFLASALCRASVGGGVDALFRYLNRNRLLVVMYHGVTRAEYHPPVWTQLPLPVFRRQLEFLREHYRMVTLPEVVAACSGGSLPERAALVTFDDGLMNNYTVAFPVLKELAVPAAVFLTVDLIGTDRVLWFDELYLLMVEGYRRGGALTLPEPQAQKEYRAGRLWDAYFTLVESLKLVGERVREEVMEMLRSTVPLERSQVPADFDLLGWEQVRQMQQSGLVSFGVHTATHRILSELEDEGLEGELLVPKVRLARELGYEPHAFCYPNGRPGIDFHLAHQEFLRECGYLCAFTTENALFDWRHGDSLGIGRISAGNDTTSEEGYFRMNTSGALHFRVAARMISARLTAPLRFLSKSGRPGPSTACRGTSWVL